MKAVLEFNLDDHFDEMSHMMCIKAKDMAVLLFDFDEYLRTQIKHAPDSMSDETFHKLQEVRSKLLLMKNEAGINLDELLN